jgi:hypothetical protein
MKNYYVQDNVGLFKYCPCISLKETSITTEPLVIVWCLWAEIQVHLSLNQFDATFEGPGYTGNTKLIAFNLHVLLLSTIN